MRKAVKVTNASRKIIESVRFPPASLRPLGAENPQKTGFVESHFFEKNRGLYNWVVSDLCVRLVFGAGAAKGALWKSNNRMPSNLLLLAAILELPFSGNEFKLKVFRMFLQS